MADQKLITKLLGSCAEAENGAHVHRSSNPAKCYLSVFRRWIGLVDKAAADLNVVIFVFAVGLATLDLTVIFTQHVIDRLPITFSVHTETPTNGMSPVGRAVLP